MVGDTGVGKSSVSAWLAGIPTWNRQSGESPGLRVTTVYWPAKLQNSLLIFKVLFTYKSMTFKDIYRNGVF